MTIAVASLQRLMRHPDARIAQVCTLSGLLLIQLCAFDFGVTPAQLVATLSATLITQAGFCGWHRVRFDWRSAVITGLSLSLLLRSHEPAIWLAAGGLAMASKFLLRWRGKHVFNPACFAIVVLLTVSADVWVSPGVWGSAAWFGVLLVGLGVMVLTRAARVDMALAFLGFFAGLLFLRAALLGDPWAIPLHQMQAGSLLIFSLFMITDPRTTPDDRAGRILFAAVVAVIAYELQFRWQIREGLFFALAAAAPLTPLIDRWRRQERFRWPISQDV